MSDSKAGAGSKPVKIKSKGKSDTARLLRIVSGEEINPNAAAKAKDDSAKPESSLPWHVAYTKPRNEKKVNDYFASLGLESYCPLSRNKRRWSDRVKWVEEPVFRSYVFVRIDRSRMGSMLRHPGLLTFLFLEGKPCMVRDEEIELIRKFLRDYTNVTTRPLTPETIAAEKKQVLRSLNPGETVTINSGMLMGEKGTVIQVRNNEVRVAIHSLNHELVATLNPELIERVK
jgi:transcription antitermination factor NusG